MKKFLLSWTGLTLIWGLAAGLTNPLIGSYVMEFIEWAFAYAFRHYGSWIGLGFALDVMLYFTVQYLRANRTNIPTKYTATKKAGKFIE